MLLTSEFQRLGIAIDATRDGEVSDEDREHGIVGRQSLLKEVAALRKILEDRGSAKTLLLGGDCATDLAPIAYHLTPDLTIVYFDALFYSIALHDRKLQFLTCRLGSGGLVY